MLAVKQQLSVVLAAFLARFSTCNYGCYVRWKKEGIVVEPISLIYTGKIVCSAKKSLTT